VDAHVILTARDGDLPLPTLGSARLPLPRGAPAQVDVRRGRVTMSGGGVTVVVPADPGTDSDRWSGLRHVTAEADGIGVRIALDDLDPYRGRHHLPAADRLASRDAARWAELFAAAWRLLTRYAPARARELAGGLTSMVPLTGQGRGLAASATAKGGFGSFGLTPPASAHDLVITLVHEFQHSKLNAVLDLIPLYDMSARDTYFAPWRTDPRPVGGLLHGVYAFAGVADTWHLLRRAPELGELAEQEFATVRVQVEHAVGTLLGSSHLTPAGRRFVTGVDATLRQLMSVPLPAGVVARSRVALQRNHQAWQARHGRDD
jgi:HEXXH motif-containing protein